MIPTPRAAPRSNRVQTMIDRSEGVPLDAFRCPTVVQVGGRILRNVECVIDLDRGCLKMDCHGPLPRSFPFDEPISYFVLSACIICSNAFLSSFHRSAHYLLLLF